MKAKSSFIAAAIIIEKRASIQKNAQDMQATLYE